MEKRGYGCIYLPPLYSPELNPIEQFWSVCIRAITQASKKLLDDEETLTVIIRDACI